MSESRPAWRRLAYATKSRLPAALALPILSGHLRGCRWIVRSANYSCWLGTYEHEKQNVFCKEIRSGDVVFDIGAHVGFYSLLASKLVGDGGSVVAFEPLESNAEYLRRHAALNRVPVRVVEVAVADRDAIGHFRRGSDTYTGALAESGETVPVVSIDLLIDTHEVPTPDVIKVDVEGAESLVLKGAVQTLSRFHPIVFLAVHSQRLRDECTDILRGLGYVVAGIDGGSNVNSFELVARPAAAREPSTG